MHRHLVAAGAAILVVGAAAGALMAQQPAPASQPAAAPPAQSQPYVVGNRVGLPINPAADGTFTPVSPGVRRFGAIYSAESRSYDAERGVIVVPNRGVPQNVQTRRRGR
jgi:hypothetical protein